MRVSPPPSSTWRGIPGGGSARSSRSGPLCRCGAPWRTHWAHRSSPVPGSSRPPRRSPTRPRVGAQHAVPLHHGASLHPGGPLTAPGRPSRTTMSGKSIVESQFERAADLVNLDAYMRRILMSPFREVQVEVPVRMDDGRIEVFTGYRIQHNAARGPCKGGIRYHPDADHDEALGLLAIMSWKTAALAT